MKQYAILYIATLAVMTLLDLTWLGVIARSFYRERMGSLMELHMLPAVLFYLTYVAGILIFVHANDNGQWQRTMMYGALFGFFAYATYDLTNLATLRNWSLSLCVVDMAWGTVVTSVAATAARVIEQYLK